MKKGKWAFDEDYLREVIADETILASSGRLSDEKRNIIIERIQLYRVLLMIANGHYGNVFPANFIPNSVIKYKEEILRKFKFDYSQTDRRLIDFVLALDNDAPLVSFNGKEYQHSEKTDLLVERSLDLYNNYSLQFFKSAKEILEHPASLVHVSKRTGRCSQCLRDDVARLPFMFVENTIHHPDNFIHELQHGIEFKEGYSTHPFYSELGPIVMETLYIDRMCSERKKDAGYLYNERVLEAQQIMHELAAYFKVMIELENMSSVTKYKFLEVLNKYNMANADLFSIDVRESLCYLLSFLKAIDIREKIYDNKKLGMQELMRKISSKRCSVNNEPQKVLTIYKNYLKDICTKQQ